MGCGASGPWPTDTESINSPYPLRVADECNVRFLSGGQDTFQLMAEYLRRAKFEIYSSWWKLDPGLHLIRNKGAEFKEEDRYQSILLERAKAGVKIFVILWDETNLATPNGSKKSKETLEALHSNIKVIRYPLLGMVWSHHCKFIVCDKKLAVMGGLDIAHNRFDTHNFEIFDEGQHKMFPMEDYDLDWTTKVTESMEELREKDPQAFRAHYPRSPWQDVDVAFENEPALDLANYFISIWNVQQDKLGIGNKGKDVYITLENISTTSNLEKTSSGIESKDCKENRSFCQIVTTSPQWALGKNAVVGQRTSVYQSWVHAISSAEHFIYVEQQFVQSSIQNYGGTENQVVALILGKIVQAIDAGKSFRVMFVIPGPGVFPGAKGAARAINQRRTMETLFRSNGLFTRVEKYIKSKPGCKARASDYVSINTMRSFGQNSRGEFKSSPIFIHSKLLVVDDRVVCVGSANVNDRSFSGTGDCEVGMIYWDKLDGQSVRSFRLELFQRLLGSTSDVLRDVNTEAFWELWSGTAALNAAILSSVFPNVPTDEWKTDQDWKDHSQDERVIEPGKLQQVKGKLVAWPLLFLANEEAALPEKIIDFLELDAAS